MLNHIFLPVVLEDSLLDLLTRDVWLLSDCAHDLLCEAVILLDIYLTRAV